jgi:hypothetical protein
MQCSGRNRTVSPTSGLLPRLTVPSKVSRKSIPSPRRYTFPMQDNNSAPINYASINIKLDDIQKNCCFLGGEGLVNLVIWWTPNVELNESFYFSGSRPRGKVGMVGNVAHDFVRCCKIGRISCYGWVNLVRPGGVPHSCTCLAVPSWISVGLDGIGGMVVSWDNFLTKLISSRRSITTRYAIQVLHRLLLLDIVLWGRQNSL